ncbi:MAG: hypothetical protein GXO86_09105 [Chlorobi bacterium]|nr:hypothetical protein [Chlorobiota bacterium]
MIRGLHAQENISSQVFATVVLQPMMYLNVEPNLEIEFGILEINQDLYHVTKQPEDVIFSIESTTNWNLSVSTEQAFFVGEKNPDHKIPVEFVGYTIEDLGTNWDNGSFSNILNISKDTILELSPERTQVLTNGRRNNMGDADMNSFIIHWKLLFESNALRMRNYSQYFMEDERFKVNVQLTLSETLCGTCN